MTFSVLGGIVLVADVAFGVFRADTGAKITTAAITGVLGILVSGLSQLFRDQSTKAVKHLEGQAVELRKDVREQTNAAAAVRLLADVNDPELRSRLQAALILEFTGAKLPDLEKSSRPHIRSRNGHSPESEDTQVASPVS
jgi:hypothetical protein